MQSFRTMALPVFMNVSRDYVDEWLSQNAESSPITKNDLFGFYPMKSEYDMVEIIEYYQEAVIALNHKIN